MSPQQNIRRLITDFLIRENIKREELCHRAGISLATLNKCMAGKMAFSEKTLRKLELAIGASINRNVYDLEPQGAALNFGGYTEQQASRYIGSYLTFRPSYSDNGKIFSYITKIDWNEGSEVLEFHEGNRLDADHAQSGFISIPQETQYVYFITHAVGQYRLAICRRHIFSGELYGIVNTLKSTESGFLVPVSSFIYMVPLDNCPNQQVGIIEPTDAAFPYFKERLARIQHKKLAEFVALA
jgi:transcriptional regulator with XRE-family HTH domain